MCIIPYKYIKTNLYLTGVLFCFFLFFENCSYKADADLNLQIKGLSHQHCGIKPFGKSSCGIIPCGNRSYRTSSYGIRSCMIRSCGITPNMIKPWGIHVRHCGTRLCGIRKFPYLRVCESLGPDHHTSNVHSFLETAGNPQCL